jgi:hypothetical protein
MRRRIFQGIAMTVVVDDDSILIGQTLDESGPDESRSACEYDALVANQCVLPVRDMKTGCVTAERTLGPAPTPFVLLRIPLVSYGGHAAWRR